MRDALIRAMNMDCPNMKNETSICYKKGSCDGHCAQFVITMMDLEDRERFIQKPQIKI